ncbi:MAG: type II toxin-antitoxin system mRNA interferase toxin, RelE/StbE family [Nitrospinae bacterium]|nr:type II toxin-antitoxin system mRNA interferase toxin, RelE/StbE family [Nitrospinota bacterium]
MKIIYSPLFARQYKSLNSSLKLIAEKKEIVFRANPFDARLKTHKLQGRLKDFWAFSLDRKNRIVFEFGEQGTVYFHSVGDHSIYQ